MNWNIITRGCLIPFPDYNLHLLAFESLLTQNRLYIICLRDMQRQQNSSPAVTEGFFIQVTTHPVMYGVRTAAALGQRLSIAVLIGVLTS